MMVAVRRPLRRPLAVAMSIALTAGLGAGACGAGRGILGTNTSPCFLALPVARHAVEGRGLLAGVRLVDVTRLTGPGTRAMRDLLNMLPGPAPHEVCVVAYTGRYTTGQVEQPLGLPPPGGSGRYAIVLVTTPKSALLGTFIVPREPLSFVHQHLGF